MRIRRGLAARHIAVIPWSSMIPGAGCARLEFRPADEVRVCIRQPRASRAAIDSINNGRAIINWTQGIGGRLIAGMKLDLPDHPLTFAHSMGKAACSGVLVLAALFLSACSGDKTNVGNAPDITGVYALVSVDGAKVPTTISHDGARIEVRSGTFTIKADGTCSSKMDFVPPTGAETTRVVKATYTRQGSNLEMRWEGAGMTRGTVRGNTFTMNNEGMTLSYQK
jgi:hypothetical protein